MSARKPRCRVGDRCFIIGAELSVNIGRIVRVLSVSPPADDRPGLWWWCRSEGSPILGIYSDKHVAETMVAHACDSSLLPIRPGSDPEPEADVKNKPRSHKRRSVAANSQAMQPASIGGAA